MAWIEEQVMAIATGSRNRPSPPTASRSCAIAMPTVWSTSDRAFLTSANGLASPFGVAVAATAISTSPISPACCVSPMNRGTSAFEGEERRRRLPDIGDKAGHWTRNVIASPDGSKLYVAVGSVSNVAESGLEVEEGRAAIHEYDVGTAATCARSRPASAILSAWR